MLDTIKPVFRSCVVERWNARPERAGTLPAGRYRGTINPAEGTQITGLRVRIMPQPPDPPWGDILPATDFRLDMNYDGLFTISDVNMSFWLGWEWLVWLFFLPGNTMIWTLLKYVPILGVFLESVREVYVFKHSFLSMRRIDAKSRTARAVLVRFSKSLASRRHLPSQANVLSTTHRLGMTSKPTAVSDRLTISVSKWGKIFFRAWSNTGPWYPPSAKSFFRNGNLPNKVPRTRTPPSRSWILAGCTMACSNRPTVSTRMWRFLPLIFLPAS